MSLNLFFLPAGRYQFCMSSPAPPILTLCSPTFLFFLIILWNRVLVRPLYYFLFQPLAGWCGDSVASALSALVCSVDFQKVSSSIPFLNPIFHFSGKFCDLARCFLLFFLMPALPSPFFRRRSLLFFGLCLPSDKTTFTSRSFSELDSTFSPANGLTPFHFAPPAVTVAGFFRCSFQHCVHPVSRCVCF